MSKLRIAVLLAVTIQLLSTPASGQDTQKWLEASAWDLAYDVTFKSSDSGSQQSLHGPTTYKRSVELSFNATLALDMRNGGASLSMTRLSMTADPTNPKLQQATMELVMRTDVMANWMSGGPQPDESASDEEQMNAVRAYMEASKGTGRLSYKMVVTGTGLVEESGSKYDLTRTTTAMGTGPIVGTNQLMFEMDAEAKKYLVTLAYSFSDNSDSTVVEEVVSKFAWKSDAPTEERQTRYSGLDEYISGLKVDDSTALLGDIPLMEGQFDPSQGKITGERTLKGHYGASGQNVAGTFVFHWTLAPR